MPILFEKFYEVRFNDPIGMPDFWNSRLKSIDARIAATEEVRADLEVVIEEGRDVFRNKANDVLLPLIEEVYEITDVGVMLRAHSATEHSVSTGGKTFVIHEGERLRFAAPAYVAVYRTDSPSAAMLGEVVSYDSGTGELVVDIDRVSGSGTHGGWTITVSSPSDTAEAIDAVLAASLTITDSLQGASTARDQAVEAKDLAETAAGEANASSGSASDSADRADASIVTLEGIYANQSQIYLGSHLADPTTDLNGNPLEEGAEYWNSVDGQKKIYNGVGWTVAFVPVGSEVTSIFGRTGNVVSQLGDYSATKISLAAVAGMTATELQTAIEELKTDTVGLRTDVDGKSALGHGHAIADVTGLQGVLDGKSATGHSHAFADLTSKPTTIAGFAITDAYTKAETDGYLALKATTAYVDAQISNLIGGAPAAALDTIAELGSALTDNDSDIASITTTLASKSNVGHGHAISDVTGLQAAIDGKSALGHGHAIADVTGLQTNLNAKLDASGYTAADVLAKLLTVDGSNSGIDADLLDGRQGSGYLRTDDAAISFSPHSAEFPSSSPASLDTRNNHPVLDFDAVTNETVYFTARLFSSYSGSGLAIDIHYSMSSATSGDVDWDAAFERIGDQHQDVDSNSFAAVNSVNNTTVPGTSGRVDVVTITFTDGGDMDSVAAGELFRLKVTRDAASDTAAGDAEIHSVVVREQ